MQTTLSKDLRVGEQLRLNRWASLICVGALAACTGAIAPASSNSGTGSSPGTASGGAIGGGAGGKAGAAGAGSSVGTAGSAGNGTGVGSGGLGAGASGGAGGIMVPTTPPAIALVPTSRTIRLSHSQWANTVRDLLKLPDITAVAAGVTGDAVVGFDNDGDSLYVSEQLRVDLADAAVKLADTVVNDATALARIMPANAPTDVAGKGKAFITAFGQRAYRRPLTTTEIQDYVTLFGQGPTLYPGGDALASGLKLVLQLFLQSPHFLYRTELSAAATGGRVALNDYEIAAKVSYALTNTMPDDTLATAAGKGELKNVANLTTQATRLLDSASGIQGRDNFHFQIYRLGTYDGIVRDATVFPAFTTATPAAMRQEVLLFTRWIYDQAYGVRELFTSPTGFVNKTLAPLYGLTGTFGTDFVKTELDPTQRAGLLTQAGFLSSYIIGSDPDSIHRGVFVNQRVLCVKLPPPSPNATPLIAPQPDMTNRERVEKTTGVGTCGSGCHSTWINPAGFAFEEFDPIGKYRTTDKGKPINSADTYPFTDGAKSFNDAVGFSKAMVEGQQVHDCYTQNWVSYLNGRPLATEEMPLVSYYALKSRVGQMSMKNLVLSTVTADNFLYRLP